MVPFRNLEIIEWSHEMSSIEAWNNRARAIAAGCPGRNIKHTPSSVAPVMARIWCRHGPFDDVSHEENCEDATQEQ
jgi:hypothetical protein